MGDAPETEEERRIRKEKERIERKARELQEASERPKETEEERRARKERERAERPKETEEERRIRKEKEAAAAARGDRPRETEEERRIRKEKEAREREKSGGGGGERPKETEEERRIRKEREAKEREARGDRPKETEEERRIRKEREAKERGGDRPRETEEERRIRKEKEAAAVAAGGDRPKETEEERRARKEREAKERERREKEGGGRTETEEERRIRKEKEAREREKSGGGGGERPKETEEERRIRKEREARERGERIETEEERRIRKEKEREREREKGSEPRKETEEERRIRKEKEREREREKGSEPRKETEEERRIRKEKEARERERSENKGDRPKETEEERRIRKEREARGKETEEERAARKAREAAEQGGGQRGETEEERAKRKEKERREREKEKEKAAAAEKSKKDTKADDDGYGEDFEDYADDFDESLDMPPEGSGDEKVDRKVLEMKKAMERENRMLLKQAEKEEKEKKKDKKKHSSERKSSASGKSEGSKRMTVLESKQLDKARKEYIRRMDRATQLLRVIELDAVTYELCDFAPQSEYDLYIGSFGSSNAAQVATQMPDVTEIDSTEVQTEKIKLRDREVSVPEDLGVYSRPTGLIPQEKDKRKQMEEEAKMVKIDTLGLAKFVSKCYPVFRVLLNETEAASSSDKAQNKTDFSSAISTLPSLPLLSGRQLLSLSFSPVNHQFLLGVYSTTKVRNPVGVNPDEDISHLEGVAAVWNINNPQAPQYLLTADSPLSCGCSSGRKGYLVFAGSSNGSVYLWDLREPDHLHNNSIRQNPPSSLNARQKRKKDAVVLPTPRHPTYSTDWMWKENHGAPIRRILSVGYNSKTTVDTSEQIATLDAEGTVMFWVIVELSQRDTEISDTDLGLSIFGRVKLAFSSQTASINPQKYEAAEIVAYYEGGAGKDGGTPKDGAATAGDPLRPRSSNTPVGSAGGAGGRKIANGPMSDGVGSAAGGGTGSSGRPGGAALPTMAAYDMEFQANDPSLFFVGSDTGYILHNTRFTHLGGPSPAMYLSMAPNSFQPPVERARTAAVARDLKYGSLAVSVHQCPTDPEYFLAGFDDGTVSLYCVPNKSPMVTFAYFTPNAVQCVRWNPVLKGFFFVLDAAGTLYLFDLFRERSELRFEPILNVPLAGAGGGKGGPSYPLTMDFCWDLRSLPKLAVSFDDGHCDVHTLDAKYALAIETTSAKALAAAKGNVAPPDPRAAPLSQLV